MWVEAVGSGVEGGTRALGSGLRKIGGGIGRLFKGLGGQQEQTAPVPATEAGEDE
jgi:hypothetical protein